MKRLILAVVLTLAAFGARAVTIGPADTAGQASLEYRLVSSANAQQQHVFDTRRPHDTLAIHAACSAGTAALTIEVSVDNTNWLTIDSISAAATNVKQYTTTTVGAGIALSPLSSRFLRVTVATCGTGNTSVLTIAAK